MKPINLKESLKNGIPLIGTFVRFRDPALVEILGRVGFDFAIFDLEHGTYSYETAEMLIRAAQLVGLGSVVRIQDNEPTLISKALDMGAGGIQVPRVSTATEAGAVVKGTYFYPLGERGVCRFTRAADYSHQSKKDYFKSAKDKVAVILQIEGVKGIENIQEITSISGVDAIFIGPYDLSQSLGIPGETGHPLLMDKMENVVSRTKKAGLAVGTFVESVTEAQRWIKRGVSYIAYSTDVGIYHRGSKSIATKLKEFNYNAKEWNK